MTKEEAKRRAELYSALAEGKTIQFKQENGEWTDLKTDLMCGIAESFRYRIKPEQKYRPFESQEECWSEMLKHQPIGWVRSKKCKALLWNVTSINKDDITIICDYYKFHRAFECFEFTDGTPFGIKKEE